MVLGHDPRLRRSTRSARPATPPAPAPASRCSNARPAREIEAVVGRIEKVETAIEPRFQEHFVDAMAIPHKTAPYPNLAAAVALPAAKEAVAGGEGRRRRRAV